MKIKIIVDINEETNKDTIISALKGWLKDNFRKGYEAEVHIE